MVDERIGHYAFILGVLIALVVGAAVAFGGASLVEAYSAYLIAFLFIIGLVVGFLNIGQKEVNDFLIAAIALQSAGLLGIAGTSGFAALGLLGELIRQIVFYLTAFVFPAALVVALKAVYVLASKPTA